jgi:acetyl-CoA carboxylase biotin carboxyl carrier protein
MDIQEIKQLIKIVEKSDIGEIELVEEGRKIRISKNSRLTSSANPGNGMVNPVYIQSLMQGLPLGSVAPQTPPAESAVVAQETTDSDRYHEVRSPMVGTFYRSPAPDADPYVDVGDSVNEGTTLCIIEAMKLMNEIESEVHGRIARILVENTQPVEYNQVLFLIEK